jgi:hypothetical protein
MSAIFKMAAKTRHKIRAVSSWSAERKEKEKNNNNKNNNKI